MDLKEFVTETLVQIQEGVQDAISRRSVPEAAGVINPVFGENPDAISSIHATMVEFDIAVTAADKTAGGVRGGLRVLSVDLGGEGSKSAEHSTVSRVKFAVRVIPPVQIVRPRNVG